MKRSKRDVELESELLVHWSNELSIHVAIDALSRLKGNSEEFGSIKKDYDLVKKKHEEAAKAFWKR